MNVLMLKVSTALMQLVLLVGQWSTNIACSGEFYQPKVPKEMLDKC